MGQNKYNKKYKCLCDKPHYIYTDSREDTCKGDPKKYCQLNANACGSYSSCENMSSGNRLYNCKCQSDDYYKKYHTSTSCKAYPTEKVGNKQMYDVLTLCRVVNAKLSQCAEFLRNEMSKESDGQTFQCVATQKGVVRAKWRGKTYYAEQGNYFAVCTPLPLINASSSRGIQQPGQTEVARLCAEANAESSKHKPRSVKILDLMYAKLTKASKWVCDYGS